MIIFLEKTGSMKNAWQFGKSVSERNGLAWPAIKVYNMVNGLLRLQ
ncbi:hypothetical protein BDE36_0713 [Arcticibacter tournemirensis]|nr:hypothetical protein [Arcticibacter tournemirensis]TQM49021.1 hypothetical protein BDE36_0713 [Arcticibacter tournemirensis]